MSSVAIFFYNCLYCEILPEFVPKFDNVYVQPFVPVEHVFQQSIAFQEQLLNPEENLDDVNNSREND